MIARRLTVYGRVQGVFYRDWTVETARALGVAGWVRNRPDGTVEAHLEGSPDTVERMMAAMHEGPARARIDRIESGEAQAEALNEFERR